MSEPTLHRLVWETAQLSEPSSATCSCADWSLKMPPGELGLCQVQLGHAHHITVALLATLEPAIKDVCWKATPYGEDAEGFITHYLLSCGPIHRLTAAAQAAGISAPLRATPTMTDQEMRDA